MPTKQTLCQRNRSQANFAADVESLLFTAARVRSGARTEVSIKVDSARNGHRLWNPEAVALNSNDEQLKPRAVAVVLFRAFAGFAVF